MPKARVAGHQLHPMLVVFPLGLWITSLVWDICYLATGNQMWGQIAFWSIVAGIVGAALAAVPRRLDWLGIPDGTRAKRVGLWHMGLNILVLALLVISAVARSARGYETPALGEMIVGWLGIALTFVSGWLGGELVER